MSHGSVSRSSVLPVFRATDGVMSSVYGPQEVSHAPQYFRCSKTQGHSGQLLCPPISLLGQVIVLDSGMSRTCQSALPVLVFSLCSVVVVGFCLQLYVRSVYMFIGCLVTTKCNLNCVTAVAGSQQIRCV